LQETIRKQRAWFWKNKNKSKMKQGGLIFSLLIIMTVIISSCSKKSNTSVQAARNKYAWVAGMQDSTGYGMILFSADSGETWIRQGQGTAALQGININDIWAVDQNNVWAVCSGNVILRTPDGGQTWARVQAPNNKTAANLLAVSIVNNTNIWISGSGGAVYNSADNGNTWRMFDTTFFHEGMMQGIWAITSQKVFVVGGIDLRGFIGYTLNGGTTWDSVSPANDYNRNEWISVVASGNTIVIYGGKSHYMVSTDGGSTWQNDSVNAGGGGGGADINHMVMLNSQTWWAALDLDHIYLTTDGGSAWTAQAPVILDGEFLVGIDAWDSHLALVVGTLSGWPEKGSVLRTSNSGTTWETIHTYNSYLNKVSFIKQ